MPEDELREKIAKVNKDIGGCPYDETIFPTTIDEAGEFLTDKGISDKDKTAISGAIARFGWNNAIGEIIEAGYIHIKDLKLISDEEIKELDAKICRENVSYIRGHESREDAVLWAAKIYLKAQLDSIKRQIERMKG